MKSSRVIIVTLVSLIAMKYISSKCLAVTCSNDAPSTNNGQCATLTITDTEQKMMLNKCQDGYQCSTAAAGLGVNSSITTSLNGSTHNCIASQNVEVPTLPTMNRVDKQDCSLNTHCATGVCNDGQCVGKDKGESCLTSYECKEDHACIGLVCSDRKLSGETCETDYHCENNHGCHKGKCTKYYSVVNGTTVETKLVDISLSMTRFCDSNYVHVSGSTYTCNDLVEVANNCSDNESSTGMCMYTLKVGGTSVTGSSCLCKGNALRDQFCPDFKGLKYDIDSGAHTTLRFKFQKPNWTHDDMDSCSAEAIYGKKSWWVEKWDDLYDGFLSLFGWGNSTNNLTIGFYCIFAVLALLF